MRSTRRLAAIIAPASAGAYMILRNPWGEFITFIFLAAIAVAFALLLLPAVWSRKKDRRDAAYGLIKLLIGSCRR